MRPVALARINLLAVVSKPTSIMNIEFVKLPAFRASETNYLREALTIHYSGAKSAIDQDSGKVLGGSSTMSLRHTLCEL